MSFAQEIGRWGAWWRGILFREEATQLEDVVAKTLRWFPQMFPDARWLGGGAYKWKWPTGEELLLRHMRRPDDYWKYHGHEYPWIGWEELTNWAFPDCYDSMMSCNRSSGPADMPRIVRATCNPFGKGHGWVKAGFIDPVPRGHAQIRLWKHPLTGERLRRTRVAIHGSIWENQILLKSDPSYLLNLQAQTDENKRKAWLEGSWDIATGGIFDGKWNPDVNVVQPFRIPKGWRVDRAFDWGSSKPYAVGWFAESDGSPVKLKDGTKRHYPRGTVFLIAELYGWNGKPNEGTRETNTRIAQRIKQADDAVRSGLMSEGADILAGPADNAIFDVIDGDSYAAQMARSGVKWIKSHKGSGSRVQGWEKIGEMMEAAHEKPVERPAFYVFDTCRQWLRTVPSLVRDDKKLDDVDTEQEDHMGDMTRYRLLKKRPTGVGVTNLPRVH